MRCLGVRLNPNEFVAETVESDVAVAAIRFGLVIEEREVGVEVTAISIVVNDYVLTGSECFGVEVSSGDAVICRFVPGVKSWLGIGHGQLSFLAPVRREKRNVMLP